MFPETSLMPQMSELMDAVFNGSEMGPPEVQAVFPPLNVLEDDQNFYVEAELPGFAMADIDISLMAGELTITGKRADTQQPDVTLHRRERLGAAQFKRVLRIGVPITSDKVQATLERGVLTITLPKAEEAKPRRIEIKHA